MKYDIIDGKPVPAALAPELRAIKAAAGNPNLNSCLRTQDAVNYARKRGHQLSSQAELYALAQAGRGNPANRPGQSTHELRSDGVAFRGPIGRRLRYWQVGQDWSNPSAVAAAARRRGWTLTVTYPGNPREAQHLNFRKEPKLKLPPLKRGSRGPRVILLTRRLRFVLDPQTQKPYLTELSGTFTKRVEDAVKAYQKDHLQKPDGVVGVHTARALLTSVRNRNKKLKAAKRRKH